MHIQNYRFGKISVNDQDYTSDIILTNDSAMPNWRRANGHRLTIQDISHSLAEYRPEVLIIGTGMWGVLKVPVEVQKQLQKTVSELYIEKTKKACELFNNNQNRKVMAALHINC